MQINLHKRARTTPAVREEIGQTTLSERTLAEQYNISRATVRKWKKRDSVEDHPHRRHGLSNLNTLIPVAEEQITPKKSFKAYEPGFVHVDVKYLPQMPDGTSRKYLFAAIDRATRWVYVEIRANKSADSAQKLFDHSVPIQALKNWQKAHPNLFKKSVYNLTGPDK